MKISYIIVTFHSENLIVECINSIIKHEQDFLENIEIVIVDNSGDIGYSNLLDVLSLQSFFSQLKIIKNTNTGYGAGNNLGINNSIGDLIAIINPDVRLNSRNFKLVNNIFEDNPNLAILGGKQTTNFLNYSFFVKPEYFFPIFNNFFIKFMNKFNIFHSKYFFLSGAFFYVRRSHFYKIGLFDENLFLFLEEADISNRFLKEGFKINFDKRINYTHLMGNRDSFNEVIYKNLMISSKYYLTKFNFSVNKFKHMMILQFYIYRIIISSTRMKIKNKEFKVFLEIFK